MAEFTPEEAREQAVKACRYFAKVLDLNGREVIAVQIDDTSFIAARGTASDNLIEVVAELGWKVEVPTERQQEQVK